MRLFRPDLLRLLLLAIFVAIAIGGSYEARSFSEEATRRFFGAWTVWMALLAPLGLLLIVMDAISLKIDLFRAPPAVFWAVQIVYFYLLACVIAGVAQAIHRRRAEGLRP